MTSQRQIVASAISASVILSSCSFASAQETPPRVDLRQDQTPIRTQLGGTCAHYGIVAAMEAEYHRLGYGKLDLSEHFSVYLSALLHVEFRKTENGAITDEICLPDITRAESSLALSESYMLDGVSELCTLFGIPEERYFPLYMNMTVPHPVPDPSDHYWRQQFHVDTFNLDPRRLPLSALMAPKYYKIKSFKILKQEDAANPQALEAVLAAGHEVIWGFIAAGDMNSPVWRYTGPAAPASSGHRMLLVGYDRSDPDNRFFIAKNSAGPTATPGAGGFTYLEYDYIKYGSWAYHIAELAKPAAWPEVAHLGRWTLTFADHQGVFDLYHIPGMMNRAFAHANVCDEDGKVLQDRRLGTFFIDGDPARQVRVNGALSGTRQTIFIDFDHPAPRWDLLGGWRLELAMDGGDKNRLAGTATAPDGATFNAVASRNTASDCADIAAQPVWEDLCGVLASKENSAKAALAEQLDHGQPPSGEDLANPRAMIEAKWNELGGAEGFLGRPETAVCTCPDRQGRYVHYSGGSIYWSPTTGAHAIYGAIRDKWAALGWETHPGLGYPTADEEDAPGGGRFSQFGERGAIYWHPDLGAFAVFGEPYSAWCKAGGGGGRLGYPVTDVAIDGPDGQWTTRFQGGVITWHPQRGVEIRIDAQD